MKNKNSVIYLAFTVLTWALAFSAQSAEISGVNLADHVNVGGKILALNGAGIRKVTIFHINVYAAGLYVEHPSENADEIATSGQLKSMDLHFMRDVGAKDIAKAWDEGFEKNCVGNCEALRPSITKLKTFMEDLKKGDILSFNFYPTKAEILVRGKSVGTVEGQDFSQNLLRCWIGKHPPNEEMKAGLLGTKN